MIWWIMAAFQIGVLIADSIYLLLKFFWLMLLSFYRLFVSPSMKSVVGETVLITGTGHGIGKELALQLARLRAKVVCLDINKERNDETVAQIIKEGGTAWGFQCDVSKRNEVREVSAKVRRLIGDVSILVNNAGIMPCKEFLRHTDDEIERVFRVNVFSQFWTIQEWLPTFLKMGRGHIVSMSSLCGVLGTPYLAPYCSSKFAVTGLMEGLLEELRYGNQNPNIKILRVHPFIVDTGLAANPRIRFPSVYRIVSAEECAHWVIEGIRREEEILFIPPGYYYLFNIIMALPRAIQHAFFDFMDTGVDSNEE